MTTRIRSLDDFLALLRGVKPERNGEFRAFCPAHEGKRIALHVKQEQDRIVLHCFAGCTFESILSAVGLEKRDLWLGDNDKRPKAKSPKPDFQIAEVYHYTDANGKPFEVVRTIPKDFRQRQPDGKGGYIWNLEGIVPTLYRRDRVHGAVSQGETIYIVEGEKDVNNAESKLGITATCNPMGALKWADRYSEDLIGAEVVIIPDNDEPGLKHAQQVATSCSGKAKRLRVLQLPLQSKDLSDWLNNGGGKEQFEELLATTVEYHPSRKLSLYPPTDLDEVRHVFKYYLFLPDPGPIEIVLAAYVANCLPGDPVWILLVGPPGYGKTELLGSLSKVQHVHSVAVLTEASLLSGTPKREAPNAKGGLLHEMGDFGIMLLKDFGGILSLTRESRGPILAGLREVYDGAWTRYVGSDGGRVLTWQGKAGLIGGATPSIDQHYAVMATLGERFVYYRLPGGDQHAKTSQALSFAGQEAEMRKDLAEYVARFLNNLDLTKEPPTLDDTDKGRLVTLATFTARCRSPIERESSQNREITLIPGAESPTRLVKVYSQLFRALLIMGLDKSRVWELITKIAFDSMPALRRAVIFTMLRQDKDYKTSELATLLGYPTNTTRRTLEDIGCYDIVDREAAEEKGQADLWFTTDWTRTTFKAVTMGVPEILKGVLDMGI